MIAPLPRNEAERLEALRRYDILDTPPEEAFDRVIRMAVKIFQTPIALEMVGCVGCELEGGGCRGGATP